MSKGLIPKQCTRSRGFVGEGDRRTGNRKKISADSGRGSGAQALYAILHALGHRWEVSRACHISRTFKRCDLRGRGFYQTVLYSVVRQADRETDRDWKTGGNGARHACSVDQERI
jgi:predicted GNAT family acetyltransferase